MSWLRESLRLLASGGDGKEQRKLSWIANPKFESLERRVHPSATPELAGLLAVQFSGDTNAAQLLQVAAPLAQQRILAQEAAPGAGDFRAIAAAPDGSIVFSGEPAGMTDGIYRLGTTPGAFTLISDRPADGLALDGQGDVIAMRFGVKNDERDPAQVTISSIAPGPGDVETVLYQDAGTGGKYEAVAADQQGDVYFAGQPGAAAADGIYQINKQTNTATLVKAGHADELTADGEGDLLAMQFGHDTYGNHTGGAAISQIAPGGAETAVYSDAAPGDYYQGLAVDANGQVLFSGQPGAGMTDGVYRLNTASGALDLLSGQPADQIAVTGNNLLALRIGVPPRGPSLGEVGQLTEITVRTPVETVLSHDVSAAAGVRQCVAVGPDGSVAVSGAPAPGLGDGIYLRAAGSSSFQRISATPADALAIGPQGNVLAMRLGHDVSGNPLGVTISSIPTDGGDHETLIYQDTGGVYEAVAADQQGNVYFAGRPSAFASVDGLYKVTSITSATLIKAGHADQLAVDGEGDLLAMQFGHDSYGNHLGGAGISSVAPASGAETVLYNDPSPGDMYNGLAVAPNGQVLIAGQPGAGLVDGIYRLNATAGTLDLVSASHADQIGADAQGDIMVLRLGRALGAGAAAAQLVEIAPQAPIETVVLRNVLPHAGTLRDVVVEPDGRAVISGSPAPGLKAGVYQLGATPGSFKLISAQAADELAVDSEGDIFAMRFGHDSYGHATGGATITEYAASGGAAVVYNDVSTADQYQDLAIDQHGNVYVAGQPGAAAADGVYKLNVPNTTPTLVAKGHVDRLAIDAEGDILAMTFGHDSYGHDVGGASISDMSAGGGTPSVIYNEPAPGGFFNDMAVGANGQILFSGQPGPGATDGVYALNPSTGEIDLLLATHADRLASMTAGVVAEGGYTLTATPGDNSAEQTLATFSDPLGPALAAQYSAIISWGDQSTSVGDVRFDSATGVFSVSGSHAYANAGDFPVTVSISRDGSPPATVTSEATVAPIAPAQPGKPDMIGVQGDAVVQFSDQTPLETVLLQNATDLRAVATGGDGVVAFSGNPAGEGDGVYSVTASGAVKLLSGTPADKLAIDGEGDVLAMRFGHDSYGHASGASISSIAAGGGETVLFQSATGSYEDIAVDQHGNVYFAGQPSPTATDGIYELQGGANAPRLIAAEHADQLNVAANGDVLALQSFSSILRIAPATGDVTAVYSDDAPGNDIAAFTVANDGQILLSLEGPLSGIFRLNSSTGILDQLSGDNARLMAVDAQGDVLAVDFSADQLVELAPRSPIASVLFNGQTAGGGNTALALAPDGSTVFSAMSPEGGGLGIYRLLTNGSLQLVSDQPASSLAVDSQGDVLALRLGAGDTTTVSSIAPGGGDVETVLFQSTGGAFHALAIDPRGNIYLAGQPGAAGATDGVYKLTKSGALTLAATGHADKLAVDAEGDILAMRFGHDAYGNNSGGATVSESAAGADPAAAPTVVYNDPSTSDYYTGLAVGPNGQLLLSGNPGSVPGIYRLNTLTGTLDLLSFANGPFAVDAVGDIVAASDLGGGAVLLNSTPHSPIETVLLPNSLGGYQDAVSSHDGGVVVSGQPVGASSPGIYRIGPAPGAVTQISATPADELAVDSEGDIFAMRFAHDSYGHNAGGASITEYGALSGAPTAVYDDASTADMYEDLAIDQHGNVYVAGQPGASAADGVYRVNGAGRAPTLVAAGHADRLAIDAEGDILAMQFGHDAYGHAAGGGISQISGPGSGAAPTTIYADTTPGDFYNDLAVNSAGQILLSGQPGPGAVNGVYTLNPATDQLALVSPFATKRIAANVAGVRAAGVGSLTATEGIALSGAVATFSDPNGAGSSGGYSATIDWGDGSSASIGSIAGPDANGLFTVVGRHTYAEESATPKTVSVTVHRAGETDVTVTDTVSVADAPLSGASATVTVTAQATFTGTVATFTDANPNATANDYTATIDWGDGATTPGTISSAGGGGFQVAGSHAYAQTGTDTITVVVNDAGGSSVTIKSRAAVATSLTPNEQYVTAVYEDVLGRAPDQTGFLYWTNLLDHGTPISTMASQFDHSGEYYGNFVIKPAYLTLLGRPADDMGVQYWTKRMLNGVTDQQLEAELIASPEFFSDAGGTNADWVNAVYKILLGRPVDADGLQYWLGQLAGGESLGDVALQIANSSENNSKLIEADYLKYLGRAADPDGLAFWLERFANGATNEDVIAGFTGSQEYYDENS